MNKRRLTSSDSSQITALHLKAFRDFFLSQLGGKFLYLYYKSFLNDPNGFGVGIFDDNNTLLGFSVVTTHSQGFNRSLFLKNFFPFFRIGIWLLLTKPGALLRLIRNMTKKTDSTVDDGNYAELFSIGVDPEKQGLGIGKLLVEDTEKIVFKEGCRRITLTTDYHKNETVIAFYKKMGYSIFYDFVSYPERRMYKMIKQLN